MEPVKQEDELGCAVACVAFVLQRSYKQALLLFSDGEERAKKKANFYCPEIVRILNSGGLNYTWRKLPKKGSARFNSLSIVFIKNSKAYPYGHFLCKYNNLWMDPWINLPDKNIRAGFRKALPVQATYIITPI